MAKHVVHATSISESMQAKAFQQFLLPGNFFLADY
jgi:hypothetical protein